MLKASTNPPNVPRLWPLNRLSKSLVFVPVQPNMDDWLRRYQEREHVFLQNYLHPLSQGGTQIFIADFFKESQRVSLQTLEVRSKLRDVLNSPSKAELRLLWIGSIRGVPERLRQKVGISPKSWSDRNYLARTDLPNGLLAAYIKSLMECLAEVRIYHQKEVIAASKELPVLNPEYLDPVSAAGGSKGPPRGPIL